MFSEPSPRPPLTPEKRRLVWLTLVVMFCALVAAVFWARQDAANNYWQTRITPQTPTLPATLELVFSAKGDLRDLHVELKTAAGGSYVYDQSAVKSYTKLVIPLRRFATETGVNLNTDRETPVTLSITATRASDNTPLAYSRKLE